MGSPEFLLHGPTRDGRYRRVRADDPDEVIDEWDRTAVENALYLRRHPAAMIAGAFHGIRPSALTDLPTAFLEAALSRTYEPIGRAE